MLLNYWRQVDTPIFVLHDLFGPVEEQLIVDIFKKLIIIRQNLWKQLDKDVTTMAL